MYLPSFFFYNIIIMYVYIGALIKFKVVAINEHLLMC